MTEKRYKIRKAHIPNFFTIQDREREYTFPIITDYNHLISIVKALNEQDEKNKKILYFISEFQNKIDDDEKKGILQIPNHIVSQMLYSIKKVIE